MAWRLMMEDGAGAADGLAADEILARGVGAGRSQVTLRLYTYRPHCALVGRFQDVAHELHLPYCEREGIEVNRRPTGGGAIIMGPDQLGVALALHTDRRSPGRARALMARFSDGLIRGLAHFGIVAAFRGKNDIEVGGRKIAGLGIYRAPSGGLLFHGSLLVDLDVPFMSRVLRTPFEEITERELRIVARRTTTVRSLSRPDVAMDEARAAIARGFAESFDVELRRGQLSNQEREAIEALARDKYHTREWLLQRSKVPDASGAATLETSGGRLDVRVAVAGRMIKALYVRGDFFESEDALADLEGRFAWHSSAPDVVAATVRAWNLSRAEGTLAPEALTRAIIDAAAVPYGCFVSPASTRKEGVSD